MLVVVIAAISKGPTKPAACPKLLIIEVLNAAFFGSISKLTMKIEPLNSVDAKIAIKAKAKVTPTKFMWNERTMNMIM